ncbi:MAG: metal-dependent transcriptional regulator [Actinomycetota bacterium]
MADVIAQIGGEEQAAAERSCADVTTGEARYLMALLDMQREGGGDPSQASLARHLKVSAPTALEMLRRLRTLGLVADEGVRLTPAGTSAALVLSSRRRAALQIMQDVLGLEGDDAEHEAAWLAASASPLLGRHLVSWRAHGPGA